MSSNWAGYVATSATATPISYTDVTATWQEPTVTCGNADAGAASGVWVGLGGYDQTSQALEQIGADADCNEHGQPAYRVWYELVPDGVVTLKHTVFPGDTITASVSLLTATQLVLQLKDRTRGWTITERLPDSQPDTSSAEWIAEAPSNCSAFSCRPEPLANFGSVTVDKVAAIGDDLGGTLTNPSWSVTPIRLSPDGGGRGFFPGPDRAAGSSSGTAGASPGPISADGRGFTVSWHGHVAP